MMYAKLLLQRNNTKTPSVSRHPSTSQYIFKPSLNSLIRQGVLSRKNRFAQLFPQARTSSGTLEYHIFNEMRLYSALFRNETRSSL